MHQPMRQTLFDVTFDSLSMEEAVDAALSLLDSKEGRYVVTPNAEMLSFARKNPDFRAVLNNASLVLPDGIGVLYAGRILGRPIRERLAGIDFAARLLPHFVKAGTPLYLLGAKPGIAEAAARKLRQAHPGLIICGTQDGYFQEDAPVVQAIRASGAKAVFVCLGTPLQELWMAKHGAKTGARLLVGLGGSLDVFSGAISRAPRWMQTLGLEWLYRLVREPARIKRMYRLPLFLLDAALSRFATKK